MKSSEEIDTLMPENFPMDWACEWGQDEYGLWNTLVYKDVRQVFRWIMPGAFLMGSPETEPERFNDEEQQHEVIIAKGFWLAETTCTQALWEAVTENNPSQFKGKEKPVEMISWDDAQNFIRQINEDIEGLNLRLPTEAEWELACRAGTTTAFSFGDNITTDMVNYNGNHPYADADKGEYRKETVEVKSLPPNQWGLYEMHGNVWEWCQDWYQDNYEQDLKINPKGPSKDDARVLRGGCWIGHGRHARSAGRHALAPDNRNCGIGLRLAQGQHAGKAEP